MSAMSIRALEHRTPPPVPTPCPPPSRFKAAPTSTRCLLSASNHSPVFGFNVTFGPACPTLDSSRHPIYTHTPPRSGKARGPYIF